jgi:hypothetical protein
MKIDAAQQIPSLTDVVQKVDQMEQRVIIQESINDFKNHGLKGATAAILTGDQIKQMHNS